MQGLAALVTLWAGWHAANLHDELRLTQARLEREAQAQSDFAPPDASEVAAGPSRMVDRADVLARLEASAESAGLSLISAQLEEQAGTSAVPAQLRLTTSVQGSYAETKQLMQQLLSEVPGAAASAFHMRRAAQPALLDTTLEIVIWSAPRGEPTR